MKRLSFTFLFSVGLALMIGSAVSGTAPTSEQIPADPAPLAQDAPKVAKRMEKVVGVKLAHDKESGKLVITAVAEVATAGYSQPTLTKVTYIKPPEDGLQDYYFMAVPPDGPAAQVISQLVARDTLTSVPDWMKGVRVHGVGAGVKEALLK